MSTNPFLRGRSRPTPRCPRPRPIRREPTQAERILAALRAVGQRGITSVDFLAPDVIDDGKPITRVAARIHELREDGHQILSVGRRNRCDVYVLVNDLAEVA